MMLNEFHQDLELKKYMTLLETELTEGKLSPGRAVNLLLKSIKLFKGLSP